MDYAIETIGLTKDFISARSLLHPFRAGKRVRALNQVNLQIERGKVFALLGPNGAGKTTLIKVLCSLIIPDGGRARVNGYDIAKEEARVRQSIGLVTGEERGFYWRLTGRQNLQFFAALYNFSGKEAKERVAELLHFLGVEEPDKRFQEYSTGIKQRLGIARSLLPNPQILFMDEPTKSLDPAAAVRLRNFVRGRLSREKGKTVFFTTHQTQEAEDLADRIAIMDKGEIKGFGTIGELRQKIGKPQARLEEIFLQLTG